MNDPCSRYGAGRSNITQANPDSVLNSGLGDLGGWKVVVTIAGGIEQVGCDIVLLWMCV